MHKTTKPKKSTRKFIVGLLVVTLAFCAVSTAIRTAGGTASGWSKTYGGTGSDLAMSVVQTSDGGYVFAGNTPGIGSGNTDVWLVKTDSDGNMLWNKTYGGTGGEGTQSMVKTTDGGFAIAAFTLSFGAGGRDFWLLKVDANGNVQWNKTYGGTLDEQPLDVLQTNDGGYILSGGVSATYFSTGTPPVSTWLVKTDSLGNMLWNKTYGEETYGPYTAGQPGVMSFTVVQTNDGGYALGSAGTFNVSGLGAHDYVLTKLDAQGTVQWYKTYGGNSTDIERALIITKDNGFAMAGYTSSFGAGGMDIWIVKTNSTGAMQWNKTYGGPNNDICGQNFFIQTADGGYAIPCYTASFGAGNNDMWLIKIDSYGNMQWSKTYGGTGSDIANCIIQTEDGCYTMVGYTQSFGAGGNDAILIKTDATGNVPAPPAATTFTNVRVLPGWTWYFFVQSIGDVTPFTYQWYENTTLLQGQTSMVLPVTKTVPGTYSFFCKVTDAQGLVVSSNNVTLTVMG